MEIHDINKKNIMAKNLKKEIPRIDELGGEFRCLYFIQKGEQYTGDGPFGDQSEPLPIVLALNFQH